MLTMRLISLSIPPTQSVHHLGTNLMAIKLFGPSRLEKLIFSAIMTLKKC